MRLKYWERNVTQRERQLNGWVLSIGRMVLNTGKERNPSSCRFVLAYITWTGPGPEAQPSLLVVFQYQHYLLRRAQCAKCHRLWPSCPFRNSVFLCTCTSSFTCSPFPPTRALVNVLWNSVPFVWKQRTWNAHRDVGRGDRPPQQFAHLRVIRCCSPQSPLLPFSHLDLKHFDSSKNTHLKQLNAFTSKTMANTKWKIANSPCYRLPLQTKFIAHASGPKLKIAWTKRIS